jgi:hypothetical protein
MMRLHSITKNGPNGCLVIEKHCGVCDVDTLFDSDHKIRKHGRSGYEKGCRCRPCELWHADYTIDAKERDQIRRKRNKQKVDRVGKARNSEFRRDYRHPDGYRCKFYERTGCVCHHYLHDW